MPKPQSVAEFIAACKADPNLDIYEMFESMPDAARNEVYAHAQALAEPRKLYNDVEPTRASFIVLGKHYNVQSLFDY